MSDKLFEIKAAIVAIGTLVVSLLGWVGILWAIWAVVIFIDLMTGFILAGKRGEWASGSARAGLGRKGGTLVVGVIGWCIDFTISIGVSHYALGISIPPIFGPLVALWYIITEMGSILENLIGLGVPVPEFLTKILNVLKQTVEDKAKTGQ